MKEQATQVGDRIEKAGLGDDVSKAAKSLNDKLKEVEGSSRSCRARAGRTR